MIQITDKKQYTYDNIEEIIRTWLMDEGIFRIKHKGDELAKRNLFVFDIDYPYNHPRPARMQVFVPKGKDYIVILCSTRISPIHVNALKKNIKIVQEFVHNFVNKMYSMQVNYNLRNAGSGSYPNAWALSDLIFFDGISKNEFYKCIRKIYNAQMISNLILNSACMKGGDLKKIDDKSFDIPFYG